MAKEIGFSDIPRIMREHPFGLMIGILILALLLIFRGAVGCLVKILIRLPFNLNTPDKILEGDICNPDKIFNIQAGEWIINLFQHDWFIWFVLILGVCIYLFYQIKKKK